MKYLCSIDNGRTFQSWSSKGALPFLLLISCVASLFFECKQYVLREHKTKDFNNSTIPGKVQNHEGKAWEDKLCLWEWTCYCSDEIRWAKALCSSRRPFISSTACRIVCLPKTTVSWYSARLASNSVHCCWRACSCIVNNLSSLERISWTDQRNCL